MTDWDGVAGRMMVDVLQEEGLLRSAQVCKLSGLSYRRLDRWTEKGWIEPVIPAKGTGSTRLWSPDVVEQIKELLLAMDACPIDHDAQTKRRGPWND